MRKIEMFNSFCLISLNICSPYTINTMTDQEDIIEVDEIVEEEIPEEEEFEDTPEEETPEEDTPEEDTETEPEPDETEVEAEVEVEEEEPDEDALVSYEENENEEDMSFEQDTKKKTRRNKNSKFIDYKTFQNIAKGGISNAAKLGDEESEVNLRKFEGEISKDYLINFHPEIQTHNYDEIATLSTIVRNQEGQIVDNFHKTLPFVSKFEKARILGVRAKQINSGAAVMIDVPEHVIDGYTIALLEYEQKKIPFIVKRPLPNGAVEYWKFADMEQINL